MHWETPYGEEPPPPPPPLRGPQLDFRPLFMMIDAVRSALPKDLERQFETLVREILMTLRALIDWYLDRLDKPRREPDVQDIPID
jgi:hypothetical protein